MALSIYSSLFMIFCYFACLSSCQRPKMLLSVSMQIARYHYPGTIIFDWITYLLAFQPSGIIINWIYTYIGCDCGTPAGTRTRARGLGNRCSILLSYRGTRTMITLSNCIKSITGAQPPRRRVSAQQVPGFKVGGDVGEVQLPQLFLAGQPGR